MTQMEPVSDNMGSPQFTLPENRNSPLPSISSNLGSPQAMISSKPMPQLFSPNGLASQKFSASTMRMMHAQPMHNNFEQFPSPIAQMMQPQLMRTKLEPIPTPNMRPSQMDPIRNKLEQFSIPNSRNPQAQPMAKKLEKLSSPKERMSQTQPVSTRLQQVSTPNMRNQQSQSMPSKVKPQSLSVSNKRSTPTGPSPKSQAESESVRVKLRESLAGSLALISKDQSTVEGNASQKEAKDTVKLVKEETGDSSNLVKKETEDTAKMASEDNNIDEPKSTVIDVNLPSVNFDSPSKVTNNLIPSWESKANVKTGDGTETYTCDGLNYFLLDDEDVPFSNFLIKDDLLQGNGLCWAPEIVLDVPEQDEHIAKKSKLVHDIVKDEEVKDASPQALAAKIEAELFKLFGGVNKKYKEKGRSLMFNLKDPSNPELREKVMSGEISPERLCSMTAEELASKELSEWRIAKAEELGKMVVLPDVNVDVRRFVRKTHKGEYQLIEYEQDDNISVEVSAKESSLHQFLPKANEEETKNSPKFETETSKVLSNDNFKKEDDVLDATFTALPNDGSDLMQGLDDLKDAEFLPPIISLDEFMESLDAEPPFENLSKGCGQTSTISDGKITEVVTEQASASLGSVGTQHAVSEKSEEAVMSFTSPKALDKPEVKETENTGIKEVKHLWNDGDATANSTLVDSKASLIDDSKRLDNIWEGLLQLNISSMVTVNGYFMSGEKTSVKDWPNFLDIKGRVRRDPFEKFLQQLPMSRSRAVMVLHFCWKEDSPESGRTNILEVAESYVADDRVGFAEPAPGVELYLCPPHSNIVEMLIKHLSKDHTESFNSIDNGLIGIVVWRKPHVSSKKNHSSRRHQEKKSHSISPVLAPPLPVSEPIDDIPPGFGPSNDDDDLPEFEFGGSGSNPPGFSVQKFQSRAPLPNPADQMRNLLNKLGHGGMSSKNGGVGMEIQPWNDDDDIPEWQPQMPSQQHQISQPSLPLPPPPPQPQPQVQNYPQQQNYAPSMHQPQMVAQQYFVPMQQQQLIPPQMVQHQIPNMIQGGQQVMVSAWPAQGATWTYQFGPNGVTMQPCNNYNGQQQQPYVAQYYGTQPGQINNTVWRPN